MAFRFMCLKILASFLGHRIQRVNEYAWWHAVIMYLHSVVLLTSCFSTLIVYNKKQQNWWCSQVPVQGSWLACHPCCSVQSAVQELALWSRRPRQRSLLFQRCLAAWHAAALEADETLSDRCDHSPYHIPYNHQLNEMRHCQVDVVIVLITSTTIINWMRWDIVR